MGTDIDSVSDVEDVEEVRERDHGDLVDAADGGGGGVEGEGPVGAVLGERPGPVMRRERDFVVMIVVMMGREGACCVFLE